jgi:hypothetical protein
VCARLFGPRGKPAGPILTVGYVANEQDFPDVAALADGSFAVAWEDDVSYYDQVYLRRVLADGSEVGPWRRLAGHESRFAPDRIAPRIAALGDGVAAVFGDRSRSRGLDVRLTVLGPRFDAP